MGRVNKVTGELEDIERGRNEYQLQMSVGIKNGVQGQDDGGHLIANILNGPGEQINYVPQLLGLNRGAWKSMETEWVNAIRAKKTVKVEISAIYSGTSKKSIGFDVSAWINGDKKVYEFDNF